MSESKSIARGAAHPDDEFFVGWLRTPRGYSRFAKVVVLAVLLLVGTLAIALPARQQSPGTAAWDTGTTVSVEGIVSAMPYAMLRAAVPGSEVRTILLVEEGKFGAVERMRRFEGQAVRVMGTFLHRHDRWMLELSAGDEAIQPLVLSGDQQRRLRPAAPRRMGQVTLQGEIINPKCYLGAMKPGGGKTHKACAALCISGGVPPMLVTRDADRQETYFLLVATGAAAANDPCLPFVGDAVELTGELKLQDDLFVLEIAADGIRRL